MEPRAIPYVENCRPGSYKARPNIPSYKVFKASNIVLKRAHLFTKGADMGPIYVLPGIILSRPPVIHCLYLGRYATLPVNQTYTSAPKEEQHITSHHYIPMIYLRTGKMADRPPGYSPVLNCFVISRFNCPTRQWPFLQLSKGSPSNYCSRKSLCLRQLCPANQPSNHGRVKCGRGVTQRHPSPTQADGAGMRRPAS